MAKTTPNDWKSSLTQLENTLNEYFGQKAPQLPKNIKELIVKLSPYFTILGIILSVPAVFAIIGIGALASPFMMMAGVGWGIRAIISLIALIVTLILEIMAVNGLFKREKQAWDKLFYVSLLSAATALISMNLFSLVVGTALSWYFLFQVRSYYK
ncbi:hypothetical protein C5B42_05345 [Candidatus Cerribacteria bacterium 'Amazon FNV 2010 28 9']|uniref:Chromate transporter n=1 Tax=Candidatus Cerribacteria bacterium 'Amazon FNV 2010 28 9' TaxID=2081795 RepID=A0A317JMX4_9BACT|nr:MAG: hypothetical protein C5B42_05345 [Candidatus Cerribacteria bacterium 'Amazon FNV 2010 28 9']